MVHVESAARLFADDESWDDDEKEGQDGRDDTGAGHGGSIFACSAFTERPAEVHEHTECHDKRERCHEEPKLDAHESRMPNASAEQERHHVNHHDAYLRFCNIELAKA